MGRRQEFEGPPPDPTKIHIVPHPEMAARYGTKEYWVVVDHDGEMIPSTGNRDRKVVEQHMKQRKATVKAMLTRRANVAHQEP